MLLKDMGRMQDAEPLLRESFDMRRSDPDLGPEHPETKESLESLRLLLLAMGRLEDAEARIASGRFAGWKFCDIPMFSS